jgi:ABC-type glycerol-3-phosphate transport system substrate-binding protein
MTPAQRARWAAALGAAALLAAACGQSKAPSADAATERREATERAKQGPYGAQVKALESAKGMEADLNKKAQEQVDKIEKDAK